MSDDQQPKQSGWNRQVPERAIGIFALIAGLALTYLGIISPLMAAARQRESVSFPLEGVVLAPLVLAIGLVYTLFGEKAARILGLRQRPSALGWVFAIVFIGIGYVAYSWLKSTLREYGYVF